MADKTMVKCPTCNGHGLIEVKLSYTDTNKPLAKALRSKGYTFREIAKMLGYKHPGSISNLLK
jgi:hypothetical protein